MLTCVGDRKKGAMLTMPTRRSGRLASLLLALVSSPATALTIYVDQDAQYRYVNATSATSIGAVPANWFALGFNDAAWFTGTAPFSSGPTSSTFGSDAVFGNAN